MKQEKSNNQTLDEATAIELLNCGKKRIGYRKGCIYSEITNSGRSTIARGVRGTRTVIYTSRWVGEICVNGKRYRFRSTNFDNVRHWVDMMVNRFPTYELFNNKN